MLTIQGVITGYNTLFFVPDPPQTVFVHDERARCALRCVCSGASKECTHYQVLFIHALFIHNILKNFTIHNKWGNNPPENVQ